MTAKRKILIPLEGSLDAAFRYFVDYAAAVEGMSEIVRVDYPQMEARTVAYISAPKVIELQHRKLKIRR